MKRWLYMLACLPVAFIIALMAGYLWMQEEWIGFKQ